jgi:hypothetical protein
MIVDTSYGVHTSGGLPLLLMATMQNKDEPRKKDTFVTYALISMICGCNGFF